MGIKKDKHEEEETKNEDMENPETESKDQKKVRKKTEKSHPTEHDDGSYEDNKKDMDETKKLVQEAIKDMVKMEVGEINFKDMIQEALQPIIKDMKTVKEIAESHDAKKSEDLKELLQKEPYEYSEDFLKDKPLEKLEELKEAFEHSKTYKDFVATQEEANKPNKEIFDSNEKMDDFLKPAYKSLWGHIYGGNE